MRRTKPLTRRDDPKAVPGCLDGLDVHMRRIPGTDVWDVVVSRATYTELHMWYRRQEDGTLRGELQVIKTDRKVVRWSLRRIPRGVDVTEAMRELAVATHASIATEESTRRPDMDPLW